MIVEKYDALTSMADHGVKSKLMVLPLSVCINDDEEADKEEVA